MSSSILAATSWRAHIVRVLAVLHRAASARSPRVSARTSSSLFLGRTSTVYLLPNIKLELVLADNRVEGAVAAIVKAAKTGKIGDGKVFVTKVDEAIRIRTEEKGDQAV